ncbi:hypothetical protein RUND412_004427 [Rhizina undulata]
MGFELNEDKSQSAPFVSWAFTRLNRNTNMVMVRTRRLLCHHLLVNLPSEMPPCATEVVLVKTASTLSITMATSSSKAPSSTYRRDPPTASELRIRSLLLPLNTAAQLANYSVQQNVHKVAHRATTNGNGSSGHKVSYPEAKHLRRTSRHSVF